MNKKLMLWILPIILLLSIVGVSADVATWRVPADVSTNSGNVNVTVYAGNGTSAQDIMGANISMRYLNNTAQWTNNSRNYTAGMDQISLTLPSSLYNDGTMALIVTVELQNTTKYNSSARTVYLDNTNPTISYTTAPSDNADQSSTSVTVQISSTEELTSAYIDFGAGRTQSITNLTDMRITYKGTISNIPKASYDWKVVGFEAGTTTPFDSPVRRITISDKTGLIIDEQGQVVTSTTPETTGFKWTPTSIFFIIFAVAAFFWLQRKN